MYYNHPKYTLKRTVELEGYVTCLTNRLVFILQNSLGTRPSLVPRLITELYNRLINYMYI